MVCLKHFLRTIALFFVPVVLLYALFGAALLHAGELQTYEEVEAAVQAGEVRVFGLAYRDETRTFKQHMASAAKAELLVLGTSRSMQLRGGFFNTESFYNAGGGTPFLPQMLSFLRAMPAEALPKNLILVLDQYFYHETWANKDEGRDTYPYVYLEQPKAGYALRRMFTDAYGGKYNVFSVLSAPKDALGMTAAGRGAGFYADGSYTYGSAVLHPEKGNDYLFADTYARIAQNTNRFEWGDTVNAYDVQATQELLAFCAQHNIAVTAVLPPYAPSVWQRMDESGSYTYMQQIVPTLQPLFAQYGFELFDYSFLPETTDAQYIDGFHGSDRVYAALCARLAADSALLAPYLDAGKLTALFTADGNPLTVALPNE